MELLVITALVCAGYIIFKIINHFANYSSNKTKIDRFESFKNLFNEIRYSHSYNKNNIFIKGSIDSIDIEMSIRHTMRMMHFSFQVNHNLKFSSDTEKTVESIKSKIKRSFGINDYQIGDTAFDEKLQLKGYNTLEIHSLLNNGVRNKLCKLAINSEELKLNNKSIHITKYFFRKKLNERVEAYTKLIISLAKELNLDHDYKKQIMINVGTEKNSHVQKRNMEVLTSHFGKDKDVNNVLNELLKSPDKSVQIAAARNLRDQGRRHLMSMIKDNDKLTKENLIEIIQTFSFNRYTKSIKTLQKVYNETDYLLVKREILIAFKKFGDSTCSEFLLHELSFNNGKLVIPILEALGACGTKVTIESLHRFLEKRKGSTVRNAVNRATAQIQTRIGDYDKGWLSVEPILETDGALSVSDEADEGALSVEDGE